MGEEITMANSRVYLSPAEVEEIYGISERTLANWRSQGKGPAYYKFGGAVKYLRAELDEWVLSQRRRTIDVPVLQKE